MHDEAEALQNETRLSKQSLRRQHMTEIVMEQGSVRIEDLADKFNISLMTAHRDLDELTSRGLLRKSRGIASAAPTSLIESSDIYRSSRQSAEKQAIAAAALEYLEPGQAVFFDDSTTVLHMARNLEGKLPLTVITNSLTLMNELKDVKDVSLIGLGGQYYNWCNAFMGHMTIHEISQLRAETLILSMSAVTDDMVFHQSRELVETKRAMFNSSSKRILLMDHTKFERRALHSFAALTEFDVIIVDDKTPQTHVERLRSKGINVHVVSATSNNQFDAGD